MTFIINLEYFDVQKYTFYSEIDAFEREWNKETFWSSINCANFTVIKLTSHHEVSLKDVALFEKFIFLAFNKAVGPVLIATYKGCWFGESAPKIIVDVCLFLVILLVFYFRPF